MSDGRSRALAFPVALGVCFFLSGAGSLVLEVVWTRLLRLVFGTTTLAISTILVAYMSGLGLGGLLGGRLVARAREDPRGTRWRDGGRAYRRIQIAGRPYAPPVPAIFPGFSL